MRGILELDFSYTFLGDSGGVALASATYLQDLMRLNLSHTKLGNAGISALAASKVFANLRCLDLNSVEAGPAGLTALARSTHFQNLRKLRIGSNSFDQNSCNALAHTHAFPNLKELDLASHPAIQFTDGMVWELVHGPVVTKLERLNLSGCLDDESAKMLASGTGLQNLTELNLSYNPLTEASVEPILRSRLFDNVKINLDHTKVKAGTVRALAETGHFRSGTLKLWSCKLSDDDIEPLVSSPHSIQLETVSLGFSQITDAGAKRLAESNNLINLRKLNLVYNLIGSVGATALFSPNAFPHLECLQIYNNPIGDEGSLNLARWIRQRGHKELFLHGVGLTGGGIVHLIRSGFLAGIRSLHLSYNVIGDLGVISLAESPDLSELDFVSFSGEGVSNVGLMALCQSPYLPKSLGIELDKDEIGPEVMEKLQDRFPQIDFFNELRI